MRFLLYALLLAVGLSSGCKCKDQHEIDTWSFGQGADTSCPTLGAYPVFVVNRLKGEHRKSLLKSVSRWNRHFGRNLFDLAENVSRYKRPKGLVNWPVYVHAEEAGKGHYAEGGKCELVKRAVFKGQSFVSERSMAWVEFGKNEKGHYLSATLSVCVKKYDEAVKMIGDRGATSIRQFGMYGILLHELGHVVMGDGTKHPRRYKELMSESPSIWSLHDHAKALIRERVIKSCVRSGRFAVRR